MRSIIGIPSGTNVSGLEGFLVVSLLEHSGCGFDMGQLALLVDVGVDEESQLMDCLLGLSGSSCSEGDDVVMDEIDLVSNSVDDVDSSS